MKITSAQQIKQMSYPDFIGAIGLENTSLSGDFAVDYWIHNSYINQSSKILEIACSTGFNLRQCAIKTGARGVGVDISETSIKSAKEKSIKEEVNDKIQFKLENVEHLSFTEKSFSHVIAGMSFVFIQKRDKALQEVARVLAPGGHLLTATVYYKNTPSVVLLDKVEKVFGFRPATEWNYPWWQNFFSRFFSLKCEVSIIKTVPASENNLLKNKVFKYILNENHKLKQSPIEVKKACADRLMEIQLTGNENALHQIGKIQVWQKKCRRI